MNPNIMILWDIIKYVPALYRYKKDGRGQNKTKEEEKMKKFKISITVGNIKGRLQQCIRELRAEGYSAWVESDGGEDFIISNAPLALINFCAGHGMFCST